MSDNAATMRLAMEEFCAGDFAAFDARLASDFVHTANPLFHREDEAPQFSSISERMASFAARGITARSRLVGIEALRPDAFVATMSLSSETPTGEGMSMLAGVVVTFDRAGRINHVHTYDTPGAARAAAATGCCDAHRRQAIRAA